MDPFIFNSVDKLIEKGAADGPIKTFNKTWELVFGKFHFYVDKVQHKRKLDFEKFKEQFKNEISSVPEENLQEPQISVLGPALEASRFYINEKDLSNMFAKLIASSMDNRKNTSTHHSFVEIIKQLSPNDAILLKHINNSEVIPAVKFKAIVNSNNDRIDISDSLIKDSPLDIESTEISINNLVRLGIINENFGLNSLTKEGIYNDFYDSKFSNHFNKFIEDKRLSKSLGIINPLLNSGESFLNISKLVNIEYETLKSLYVPWVIDFDKGSLTISAYGKAFVKTCVN
ncbi:DUF4393 domain-containing protein [Staphylococcus saprophyticus]|nr:DUF4393 domain-containing protein [Staphylococcus saprophyticus]